MITVVIPLYNKEQYINKCINSVLEQTYPHFEICVVNDGSSDNSARIVKAIKDPRLTIISIKNSGVSVARNTGIKAAKNTWIAFLDADDWWAPSFLSTMVRVMEEFPKNKIFASGRSRVFKTHTERYAHSMLPLDGETEVFSYFRVISKYLPLVNSSNIIVKKNLFFQKGFFKENQKKYEDHDMWLRLCVDNPVVFCNKNLSFYLKTASDTASSKHFTPRDYIVYLKTLSDIKTRINKEDLPFYKMYLNRFVRNTYFINYESYTKQEETQIYKLSVPLVSGKSKGILKMLYCFPYKKIYRLLKRLK